MRISRYWKSVVAGAAAGTAALGTAVQDGTLTTGDGVAVVLAVLGTLGITWAVPNREPKGQS
ncbi:hypothetical protein RI578_06365 [Streptomyces sp. BB1-1-1]|uniref:hypothetical protein n=1 Tax=Streptomyces sp. BB1-1-1 TaxID=3074430 RepID=UPI002877F32D|nr:hypothetical protein [Streptomyces sp. BB1-1-1]WND33937.1 hypothetical protein RI578_06365 [Streptomyces sp. BB1-1-1]